MPFSAPEAYRKDREGHDGQFSSQDDAWIIVASLATQAAYAPPAEARRIVRRAADLAAECFGPRELHRLAAREWKSRPRRLDALLLVVGGMQNAGAFHLATATVDGLLGAREAFSDTQCGRLRARRAQLSHRLNDPQLAAAQYAELDRSARKMGNTELRARAALGMAAVSQVRGNYVEMWRHGRRAARLALRTGLPRLTSRAAYAWMAASAQREQYDEALVAAWTMNVASRGDSDEEAMSLIALGQMFLRLGRPATAYTVFSGLVRRRLASWMMLGALGKLALAAASPDVARHRDVEWAADEITRLHRASSARYDIANALFDCAAALLAIGDHRRAATMRHEAMQMAEQFGFHEIVIEGEAVETRRLSPRATRIVRQFDSTPPEPLPLHVATAFGLAHVG